MRSKKTYKNWSNVATHFWWNWDRFGGYLWEFWWTRLRFNLKNEESENERFVEARAQFSRFHGMLLGRKMDVNSASGVEETLERILRWFWSHFGIRFKAQNPQKWRQKKGRKKEAFWGEQVGRHGGMRGPPGESKLVNLRTSLEHARPWAADLIDCPRGATPPPHFFLHQECMVGRKCGKYVAGVDIYVM